jgi:hypothetical protein
VHTAGKKSSRARAARAKKTHQPSGFIPKGDRVLGYNIIVVPQRY